MLGILDIFLFLDTGFIMLKTVLASFILHQILACVYL